MIDKKSLLHSWSHWNAFVVIIDNEAIAMSVVAGGALAVTVIEDAADNNRSVQV